MPLPLVHRCLSLAAQPPCCMFDSATLACLPSLSGNAFDPWLEEPSAVAGILVDGDQLDGRELGVQFCHRQRAGLACRVAADLDGVLVAIDRGRDAGVVVPHEERIVGRDGATVEDFEWRLELRWPRGRHDQRAFLGVGDEPTATVVERERDPRSLPSMFNGGSESPLAQRRQSTRSR
jgi:hypothetical protein